MAAFCVKQYPVLGTDFNASKGKVNLQCLVALALSLKAGHMVWEAAHPSVHPLLLRRPPSQGGSFADCGGLAQHPLSLCRPGPASHFPGDLVSLITSHHVSVLPPHPRAAGRERAGGDGARGAGSHDVDGPGRQKAKPGAARKP